MGAVNGENKRQRETLEIKMRNSSKCSSHGKISLPLKMDGLEYDCFLLGFGLLSGALCFFFQGV